MEFDSRADQIRFRVANGSPPLRCFFEMIPSARYTLWRNIARIINEVFFVSGSISMQFHKTSSAPCVRNLRLNHKRVHKFFLPPDESLERYLRLNLENCEKEMVMQVYTSQCCRKDQDKLLAKVGEVVGMLYIYRCNGFYPVQCPTFVSINLAVFNSRPTMSSWAF